MLGALLAIAILVLQLWFHLIPQQFTWQAVVSVALPYLLLVVGLVAVSAIRSPVAVDKKRQEQIDDLVTQQETERQQSSAQHRSELAERSAEIEKLKSEVLSLQELIKSEAARRLVEFSFWLAPTGTPLTYHVWNSRVNSTFQTSLPGVSLVVFNEAESSMVVLGYEISTDNEAKSGKEENLGVGPGAHGCFLVTDAVMQVLSGPPRPGQPPFWDVERIKGEHTVTVTVRYQDRGETRSRSSKVSVRVSPNLQAVEFSAVPASHVYAAAKQE